MIVHSIPCHSQEDAMKQRVTLTMEVDLIRKARQAVKAGAAPSLVSLVVEGLTRTVRRIERARGRRFWT